jgi:hypothetical protein
MYYIARRVWKNGAVSITHMYPYYEDYTEAMKAFKRLATTRTTDYEIREVKEGENNGN